MIEKLRKKISNYFSPEDYFIHDYDKRNPEESSALKQQEIDKQAKISRLRDSACSSESTERQQQAWWDDF